MFLTAWHIAVQPRAASGPAVDPEYARLVGGRRGDRRPNPDAGAARRRATLLRHLKDPFYVRGTNDMGLGIQLAYSLRPCPDRLSARGARRDTARISDRHVAADLPGARPLHPGAEADLAARLDAARALPIRDSSISAVFVIFICSIWPMLINTAFGVASVRKEWLNVARTLEVGPFRRAITVILPAAAPTILTGMRISIASPGS